MTPRPAVHDDNELDLGETLPPRTEPDDEDDIWDTSVDEPDGEKVDRVAELLAKPMHLILSPIALVGVSAKTQKQPVSAMSNEWLLNTFARMSGLAAKNPEGPDAADWRMDVEMLQAAARARDLTLEMALIPSEPTRLDEDGRYRLSVVPLPMKAVSPDPAQARDEGADDELSASIAESGVLQPIRVYEDPIHPGFYIIEDGERRYRGSAKAGLTTIPAIVVPAPEGEGDKLLIQVASNDGKRLKPMEEARTFKRIMADKGWSIQQLADHLGKAKSTVSDRVAILDAPAPFHPLFAAGVLTAAAAPLVRKFKDVPADVLSRFVEDMSKGAWNDYVATESAASLREVEQGLHQLTYHYARRLDSSVAKHYEGPTCTIGKEKFATDIPAYEAARTESYKGLGSSSASTDRYRQQEAERRRKENAAQKKRLADRRAQFAAISAKLPGSIGGSVNQAAGWAELLVDLIAKEVQQDTLRVLAGQLRLVTTKSRNGGMGHYGDAVRKHARALDTAGRVKLALQLLLASDLSQPPYISGGPERFAAAAKLLKIDLKKVKAPETLSDLADRAEAAAAKAKATKKARR